MSAPTQALGLEPPPPSPALAIQPLSLVASPSSFAGLAGVKRIGVQDTTSASDWANAILEDTPANAQQEVTRLEEEGFGEGVYEYLTVPGKGVGLSAAIVVGSTQSARRELGAKVAEELKELGKSARRFRATRIPGAVGLEQPNPKGFRINGLYPGTLQFSTGRCVLAVGTALNGSVSRQKARGAMIAAATAIYRRAKPLCS